jgi:hypothetical protein
MGRPCIGERPMTTAERMRRYRRRKRLDDVRAITYRPLPAVTKPVSWGITKSGFDPNPRSRANAPLGPAERARDIARREAERAREATRKAIDLAHALIG